MHISYNEKHNDILCARPSPPQMMRWGLRKGHEQVQNSISNNIDIVCECTYRDFYVCCVHMLIIIVDNNNHNMCTVFCAVSCGEGGG